MKNGLILLFSSLFMASCASTGVVSMGQDLYYIGKKDGSPGVGVSFKNKAQVYAEATEFCQKKKLDLKILKETVTPSAPGRLGSTELQFKCIQAGSEGTPLLKEPDTVIEIRQ